jgi:PAS domain S-box-containing protein
VIDLGRVLLLLVLVASGAFAGRVLTRGAGPVVHWMLGWGCAGVAGLVEIASPALPVVRYLVYPLGSLFPALLLSGALAYAGRPLPRWLLPAALVWGLARAGAAAAGHPEVAWSMALACESFGSLAAAVIAWRAAKHTEATGAERLLGPAMVVLAAVGAAHAAWLASGRPPEPLVGLWLVVTPPLIGLQVQAGADRVRREVRRSLEREVAARTAELTASEERYRAISELSSDFSFRVRIDPELRLTREWIGGAYEAISGLPPEALDGHGWLRTLTEENRARIREELDMASSVRGLAIERDIVTASGERRWLVVRLAMVRSEADGSLEVLGSARDVTERRRSEEERRRLEQHIQQAQKLDSLGMLAGGIAHDFNNLLTVIRGNVRLALVEVGGESPLRARLERVREAAGHAAALTDQLLSYAGKSSPALGPLDLRGVVSGMRELLRASVSERCALELDLPAELPAVEGDAGQIRQVLLNLVLNGAEALGARRGRVSIRLALVRAEAADLDGALGSRERTPGERVLLEVRDDGGGMDAATAERVFEPFFSTKFSGRGLGMAAVLGIVQAHRGAIRIDSEPEGGTAVRVYFPPSPRVAAEGEVGQRVERTTASRGALLVVDDDAAILDLDREILVRAGYDVLTAPDGGVALELLRGGTAVDAVVLDLTMPGLGGEETFLQLRQLRPALPVILVSGFDAAHTAERFAAQGLDGFLRKPFEPEDLVAMVGEVLAR